MTDDRQTTRPIYWKHWLARMGLHCTFCRFDGRFAGTPEMGNPEPGTNAPSLVLLLTADCNPVEHKAAFIAKQRAAFRRHIAAEHPALMGHVKWSR